MEGNALSYTYRRLLRDRPDLAQMVKAGAVKPAQPAGTARGSCTWRLASS